MEKKCGRKKNKDVVTDCIDSGLCLVKTMTFILLEQSSTDSLSKGNIIKTKGAEGILSACRLLEMHIFVSPFLRALEFIVKGVVGHCQMALSGNEGQQLLADC